MEKIRYGFPQSFLFSLHETKRLTGVILEKAIEIPRKLVQTGSLPEGLAGPVGIADVTHQVVPSGFIAILKLAALLSLSLAVMNLLPIPALDGGRLLFQLVELVLKPLKVKINESLENAVHLGGYVLLMLFLVAVTWNDIVNLIS